MTPEEQQLLMRFMGQTQQAGGAPLQMPNLDALTFLLPPSQKVLDPFGTKIGGKDQSRLPQSTAPYGVGQ